MVLLSPVAFCSAIRREVVCYGGYAVHSAPSDNRPCRLLRPILWPIHPLHSFDSSIGTNWTGQGQAIHKVKRSSCSYFIAGVYWRHALPSLPGLAPGTPRDTHQRGATLRWSVTLPTERLSPVPRPAPSRPAEPGTGFRKLSLIE